MDRRRFLQNCALTGVIGLSAAHPFETDALPVPDDGWRLWLDKAAPTGGWNSLYERPLSKDCISVTLPATVEQ
jgi:hypothetical protein